MPKTQLSEKVRELIQKARIVSFDTWQDTHPALAIQRLQAADDQGRYLTDADYELPSSRYAELEVSDASFELLTFSHPKRD